MSIMSPDELKPENDPSSISNEDFDFEFDDDFEAATDAEYAVMNAMRFDKSAGTAKCDFNLDEEDEEEGTDSAKASEVKKTE